MLLSLDVSWWGKSRFFSHMSIEGLSIIHIVDVMWSTNSGAIALHAFFVWIILNFSAIERPWARSLLQLPETFACVTS